MNVKDVFFMKRALDCARKGIGCVHPNPLVGAVWVKNNRILGEGSHERFGEAHAEVNAIRHTKKCPIGGTLYVTLEPCCHFGKTPPCTDLILKQKIKRVVIAAKDPHSIVSGKGIAALKRAGIQVTLGVLEKDAEALNRDYFHFVRKKMPYGVVKIAQSLDGKIATSRGESRWISGKESRIFSHRLRAESDAILVGVETILKDDPLLNVRLRGAVPAPVKVVVDSSLRTPPNARIFSKESAAPVILAVTERAPKGRWPRYKGKAEIWVLKQKNGKVDLTALFRRLAQKGLVRVLIEGGGEVVGSAFSEQLVNEVYFFIAPKVLGGKTAIGSVGGNGVPRLENAIRLKKFTIEPVGEDWLAHGVI